LRRGTIETDSAYVGVGAAILIHRIRRILHFEAFPISISVGIALKRAFLEQETSWQLLDELHVSPRVIRRRPDRICAVSLQYKNKLRNCLMYLYSL
jgi:hypothetical protein